jgi:hypothetical protein
MKRLKRRRQQRGWIMLMVLMILLLLGIAVAGFYTQTESHLFTGQSLGAYAIASTRAEMAAQEAISLLRSGAIPVNAITSVCNDQPPANPFVACAVPGVGIEKAGSTYSGVPGPYYNPDPAADLKAGGGLLYHYIIYRPQQFLGNTNLYAVRAIGYYGRTLTSNNLYTSELEVMVEVGVNNMDNCRGANDYGGCGGG